MKKLGIPIFLISSFMLGVSQVNAAPETATDSKTATFDIVDNPNGTILLEAGDLTFGSHTISPLEINAVAKADASIKITEYSGLQPGWNLTVKLDKFKDTSKGITLDGVRLFYPQVTPTTTTGGNAANDAPTTEMGGTSFVGSIAGKVVNDDNTEVKLASAAAGKGYGIWNLSYNDANSQRIQIQIPEGQKIGNFSADLTYTLKNVP